LPPEMETLLINIQKNSLISLKALSPMVEPVMFTKDPMWIEIAKELQVVVASRETHLDFEGQKEGHHKNDDDVFEENQFGLPFFRSIMSYLENNYFVPFYGVADSNIMFANDLISTLHEVNRRSCSDRFETPRTVVFSRQMGLVTKPDFNLRTVDKEQLETVIFDLKKPLRHDPKELISYIIMSRGHFNWTDINSIPNFVVRRPSLYQSVAYMAKQAGGVILDCTRTLTCIRLNGNDFVFTHPSNITTEDLDWNTMIPNPMGLTRAQMSLNGHTNIAHHYALLKAKQVGFEKTGNARPKNLFPPE